MNRYMKTSLTSLFAISLLAGGAIGQANASGKDKGPDPQEREMIDQGSTGSISNDTMMNDQDVGSWQEGKINVVVVSSLNDDNPSRTFLEDRMKANPDGVLALQTAIQNNPALKAQLESQNVQLNNIVAADKAADGSVTFYVR